MLVLTILSVKPKSESVFSSLNEVGRFGSLAAVNIKSAFSIFTIALVGLYSSLFIELLVIRSCCCCCCRCCCCGGGGGLGIDCCFVRGPELL